MVTHAEWIGVHYNKGEAMHSLRSFIRYANEGNIRKSQLEDQVNQAACLTLLANIIIVWNTRYIQLVIEQLRAKKYPINEEDLKHVSLCRP